MRPAAAGDERFLRELDAVIRRELLGDISLPEPMLLQLLASQYHCREAGYRSRFPGAESFVVVVDEKPVGRLLLDCGGDVFHVVDIALLPGYRGFGIGTGVLEDVARRAERARKSVRLQVQRDNQAVRLYSRLGYLSVFEDEFSCHLELPGREEVGQ
jgi:GNAT superfamily N-acetyltransferase